MQKHIKMGRSSIENIRAIENNFNEIYAGGIGSGNGGRNNGMPTIELTGISVPSNYNPDDVTTWPITTLSVNWQRERCFIFWIRCISGEFQLGDVIQLCSYKKGYRGLKSTNKRKRLRLRPFFAGSIMESAIRKYREFGATGWIFDGNIIYNGGMKSIGLRVPLTPQEFFRSNRGEYSRASFPKYIRIRREGNGEFIHTNAVPFYTRARNIYRDEHNLKRGYVTFYK